MLESLKISGVMPVYHGSDGDEVAQCLASIFAQTRKPDELVIIYDGPVSKAVEDIIAKAKKRHGKKITLIKLPENIGNGPARNAAIKAAKHPYIVLFDSDDLYPENRIALQIAYFEQHPETDILGGQIEEFDKTPGDKHRRREVPISVRAGLFTLWRSPMNQTTVIFRAEMFHKLGGYRDVPYMEDYDLWLRALAGGYRIANLPEVLSHVRVGSGMYGRRVGLDYAWSEIKTSWTKMKAFSPIWWLLVFGVTVLRASSRILLPSILMESIVYPLLRKIRTVSGAARRRL